jgi:hypothetical protein
MVAIEGWWGFLLIDGDFSGFDGIVIWVKGLFTRFGTLMNNELLSYSFRRSIDFECI